MAALPSDGPAQPRRVAETRRRHGDDFYARIGRKSWELRQRAREGDDDALAVLSRRRVARETRRAVWLEVLDAREAATLLRQELANASLANAEPSRAVVSGRFRYTDQLREELRQAEARLAGLEANHQRLLADLRAPLISPPAPPD